MDHQIKIFTGSSQSKLENSVNEWLKEMYERHSSFNCIDIKFNTVVNDHNRSLHYQIMAIYKI